MRKEEQTWSSRDYTVQQDIKEHRGLKIVEEKERRDLERDQGGEDSPDNSTKKNKLFSD